MGLEWLTWDGAFLAPDYVVDAKPDVALAAVDHVEGVVVG